MSEKAIVTLIFISLIQTGIIIYLWRIIGSIEEELRNDRHG